MEQKDLVALLHDMSLEEKIGQMIQLMSVFYDENLKGVLTGPAANHSYTQENIDCAGSILGTYGAEKLTDLQKKYMEKHPHHIPLLFMMDVIHGMKTVFPNPLGLGATFDPALVEECAQVTAKEAAVSGLHVTFTPMVDLVRDARWGRVMESTGEDPWLNSQMARGMVRGLQGDDMKEPYRISACIKHFAAYGAPTAGRDYNTVELSESTLRDQYLPAYQAGIEAGAGMVMSSFNTINGVPATGNKWLMRDILRKEMKFDGVLISDFGAVHETVNHGYAADDQEAAQHAIEAGVDIDMMDSAYATSIKTLLAEGKLSMDLIDEAVLRILELKNKLGLFENPYKDADPEKEKQFFLCPEHRALARKTAQESLVLLKNDGVLPLKGTEKIACIGPYAEGKELISSWTVAGKAEDCVSIREAAEEIFGEKIAFYPGSIMLDEDLPLTGFEGADQAAEGKVEAQEQEAMLRAAVEGAKQADLVILCLGEHILQSGEATSRAFIDLPEVQMRLFRAVQAVNPHIVTVIINGRPLDLREISEKSEAVLVAWRPGTEGGHAIWDVLTGAYNPSGCLPMSFPYFVGQVPVHYNAFATGRPYAEGSRTKFVSRYLDIPNKPLYPFGYGLSYTTFELSPVKLDRDTLRPGEALTAEATVKNMGDRAGTMTLQLYLRDVSGSRVRPVKELKGVQKVFLNPGEEKAVRFTVTEDMLCFFRADGTVGSEPGQFQLWIGRDSATENGTSFILQ